MRLINYVGEGDVREISRASIIAAGLPDPGVDLVWNHANGFELNVADQVAAYLLAADTSFQDDAGLDFGDLLGLNASAMAVIPAGEMVATDVQAALEDLYLRTMSSIDLWHTRLILREDFLNAKGGQTIAGYTPDLIAVGDRVGQNGFWVPSTASVAPTWGNVISGNPRAGAMFLGVSTAGHWTGISLGAPLSSQPEWRLDFSVRVVFGNTIGAEEFNLWDGLHDGINGVEPSNGVYLEYSAQNALQSQYHLVFANGGARTKFALGVVQENTLHHPWKITCDGANDPTYRVWYDGVPTPTNSVIIDPTNVPVANRFGPNFFSRKILGAGLRSQHLDYVYLDWKRSN